MRLRMRTEVGGTAQQVMAGFDRALFEQLSPPFPKVQLRRFDGSRVGDEVHLQLDFVLFSELWVSKIVDAGAGDREHYFVDEGTQLPFFLKSWRHVHRIVQHTATGCIIEDDVTYRTGTILTDWLMYPGMWLQFAYRKPRYRRAFPTLPTD